MSGSIDLYNLHNVINDIYYPYITNKSRFLVLYGSAGSGKSRFAAQKIIIRILAGLGSGQIHKFLCIRKHATTIKRSIITELSKVISDWNLSSLIKVNKVEMSYTFPNGSQILCQGLDDPEKLKSISGITSMWCEEPSELTSEDFTQLNLRLRGKISTYKQIILTFNPISKLLWIYPRFFEYEEKKASILHTTYKDNRFIDDEYKEILEDLINQDQTISDIYCKGIWGTLPDVIYSNYKIVDKLPQYDEVCYGLDFGYNVETALVKIGTHDGEYYLEQKIYKTKLTNSDLIEILKTTITNRNIPIYCDSQNPERIEELRRAGFNAHPSNKSVKDGLDFCKRGTLHIHSSSIDLIEEVKSYQYKKDRALNVLDEPVKFRDHACDAFRYAIYTHFGNKIDVGISY